MAVKREYSIECYTIYKTKQPKMEFFQDDTNSSKITFNIYDGTEAMTDITSASAVVTLPNGTTKYTYGLEAITITDNQITFTLPPTAVFTIGKHTFTLSVFNASLGRATFGTFEYKVNDDLLDDSAIVTTEHYPVLVGLITDIQTAKANIDQAVSDVNILKDSMEVTSADLLELQTTLEQAEYVRQAVYDGGEVIADLTTVAEIMSIDIIRKPSQRLNVACTLMGSSNSATFDTWNTKLTGLDCDIQLSTLEYITDALSVDFTPTANLSNATIASIKSITGKNISVLKPHIVTLSGGDSFSRTGYNPTDKTSFFTNWTNRMLILAQYCINNNIPNLCITTEMATLTNLQYTSQWKTLIDTIKASYPTLKIVTAYTMSELNYQVNNANDDVLSKYVDVIGLNFYPTIYKDNLMKSMVTQKYVDNTTFINSDDLILRAKRFGKPLYITETGCSNYSAGTNEIYPIYLEGTVDYVDMRIWYKTIHEYLANNSNIEQVHIWHINTPFDFLSDTESKAIIQSYYGGGN